MHNETAANHDPGRWVAAIASNADRAAFAALFQFYAPRIKGMLMRMGVASDTAEDIAQDALVTIWRKAASYDPARASVSAWVYTIARNLRIDRLRRDKLAALYARDEVIEPEGPERPDAPLDAAERGERVRAALVQLPAEQGRIVTLSFFDGRPHSDIAALLDLPIGTVKSRLRLAMTRLRNLLGDLT
ncbi:MAG: sigma-70 family RNA polymerase sigma factor [Xanthobacteraceae bacterium]